MSILHMCSCLQVKNIFLNIELVLLCEGVDGADQ